MIIISNINERVPRNAQFVTISDGFGITEIPDGYFKDCHQLKYIQMPDDICKIGHSAFLCCRNLRSIELPKKLYSIGENCFRSCEKLKFINLPRSVHHVAYGAFEDCSELEYINLSENMKYLSASIFQRCVKLRYLEIPQGIREIRFTAFSECLSLVGILLPDTLTHIDLQCFMQCLSLTKFTWKTNSELLDPYISIKPYAFLDCRNLRKLNLSESSVFCLEEGCFGNCYNLEIVLLSKKTKNIHESAFQNCRALKYMHYDYRIEDEDPSYPFYAIDLKKVNSFDDNVFRNCTRLQSIKIYDYQHFGQNTLHNCSNLKKISISGNFFLHDCDLIHNTTQRVEEIIIRSELNFITQEVVEKALVPCVLSNYNLLENVCTEDGLIPIQLYIEVMLFRHKEPDTNDKVIETIFLFLREGPSTITLLL